MRIGRYTVLLFIFTLHFHVQAQETVPLYLGTKTIYHPLQSQHTQPPKGFTPVFINYVGRHGARFLTKPGSDVLITDVLQQAKGQNALTPTGKQVLETLIQFDSAEANNYENITLLGADEQRGIGTRMYNEYKPVFKGNNTEVFMTTKKRTQQSADAFLEGFPNTAKEKVEKTIIADSVDTMLRFYDMSPAYDAYSKSKTVSQHLDSLLHDKKMIDIANRVGNKLFSASFYQQLVNKNIMADNGSNKQKQVDVVAFVQALYDVYTVWFSASKEIQKACSCTPKNGIQNAFINEDLQWLSLVSDADDFYRKGPAEDTLGIQVTIASPLLINFINTTDSVVNGWKKGDAILRFTHAEAISPFATLSGISEASKESGSVYNFQKHWQASQIIPLSANVQWILYSNGKGKPYLVKVLLNEKEAELPVATTTFPYYNWQSVRAYYSNKLQKLGIRL